MVGLPSVESREMIMRTLLSKEKAEDLDFKELATMTEGYSGSDLKVCPLTYVLWINCFVPLISSWTLRLASEFVRDRSLSACSGALATREIEGFGNFHWTYSSVSLLSSISANKFLQLPSAVGKEAERDEGEGEGDEKWDRDRER